ncbi:MAG: type 1 periplasmic-binding domain-containing protein [Myxococcaceae bacterium]
MTAPRGLVFALWALASACGPAKAADLFFTLGADLDRSGSAASATWPAALQLAVKDANAGLARSKGTKFGAVEFRLQLEDHQSDNELARTRALQLRDFGAKALIVQQAPTSIAVNALNYDADETNDVKMPLICPNCVIPSVNNPAATDSNPDYQAGARDADNWLFRTVMSNAKDAAIQMKIVTASNNGDLNSDGKFKLDIYASASSSHDGFRTAVRKAALAVRPDALIEDAVRYPFDADPNGYDFRSDMARLVDDINELTQTRDAVPDVLVEQGPPAICAAITRAYKLRGDTVRLLHNTNFRNPSVIEQLGDMANGEEGTSMELVSASPAGAFFAEHIAADTGLQATIEDSNFYDSATVLFLAAVAAVQANGLEKPSEITPVQLRDALYKISDKSPEATVVYAGPEEFAKAVDLITAGKPIDYEGASGPVDFDAIGDVKTKLVRWVVEARQFRDVDVYDCVSDPLCPHQP